MADLVDVSTYHKHYELQSSSANTALLRTCRAIYQEAVDVLYSANTFDASHPQTFVCFARTIPPQRLASISSLQVAWLSWWTPLGYESERGFSDGAPIWWKPLWEIAATQMPGLKHVRLHLHKIEKYSWREAEELLLRDLLPLRGLSSFNLERTGFPEPTLLVTGEVRPVFSDLGSKIKDIVCAPRTP
ncbi:hypothetical protein MPH_08522 [Macrophomina phaseolina MS6]|uniref:DUF7730 domain-containing protein n=1 Tax=Macrophomina phaseolina (strain MS6) TaxID=1126212 RepID=K2RNF8_MACPH|nr:hypothetical protein MPH_08522 [Macrophomina phaseolina MS6]